MAKYRQVHIEFWQDGFVLDLTPEEKYFYIYLMTNSKTSQCGIYELPKRIIETETGYNRDTVDKLIKRFIQYGKIQYDDSTQEIMLLNWIKYNAIKSPKVIMCINKELGFIKNKRFVSEFVKLCKRYKYGIDTLSIDYGEEEEEEKEEEKEVEGEENNAPTPTSSISLNCFDFYQNNFGLLTPHISEKIGHWLDDFNGDHEVIIKAMEITLERNKRQWSYTESILRDWNFNKLKTLNNILVFEQEKYKNSKKASKQTKKKEDFDLDE